MRYKIYKRTGLYPFLTSSICDSVTAATSCFLVISSDNSLLDDKTSIAVSSSKMLPYKTRLLVLKLLSYQSTFWYSLWTMIKVVLQHVRHILTVYHLDSIRLLKNYEKSCTWDVDRTSNILSSISFSCLLVFALSRISSFFCSSSCGFSLAATIPSSWSSKPMGVIMKFTNVTYIA